MTSLNRGSRTLRTLIVATTLIAVAGNAYAANWKGADGYQFEGKQYDKSSMVVRKVEYPSLAALRAAATNMGKENPDKVNAFSQSFPELNVCVIHEVDPTVMYLPEDVGHELDHCFYGDFHAKFTARAHGR